MEMMTPQEAAEVLKVTPRTISIWLKNGKLPGFKLGSGRGAEWRLGREELELYLKSHANTAQRQQDEERWQAFVEVLEKAPEDDEPLTKKDVRDIKEGERAIKEGRMESWGAYKQKASPRSKRK